MAAVSLTNVSLRYPQPIPTGLFDCTLQVVSGELLAIVGPSGAGKSTLLRIIAGLERPDSGTVQIGGQDMTHWRPEYRDVGLLPQRPILYPHLTVLRNLSISLEMRQGRRLSAVLSPQQIRSRVDEAIDTLELNGILNRSPHELSGGESQRVALGRLLVRRPAVWLLDEPFSHLDTVRKLQLRHELLLLRGHSPATMIFVTHDPDEAVALGQRLAVLQAGRIRQVGEPTAVLAQPKHRSVVELLERPTMNLVHGAWARVGPSLRFAAADGTILLPMPAELVTHGAEGQPVTVGIRPADLRPARLAVPAPPQDNWVFLDGWEVRLVELFPPRRLVTASRGQWQWSFWADDASPPAIGERVSLGFSFDCCLWFDGDGNRVNGTD